MTQTKRVRIAALALICATIAGKALAGSPQVLTPADAQSYARAFESVDRGDFIDATMQTLEISDPSLSGYITYRGLMHPTAHKSNFEELSGWLARYADLPVAERIYTLASKRKTPDMAAPAVPGLIGTDWNKVELVAPGSGGPFDLDNARLAREAFYSGDSRRALDLAKAVGERWIAGMAAYRLRRYDQAETHLSQVAQDTEEDIWVRAGAVGLMQLMPDAAAHATGDKRLRDDMSPLFDPSFNLKVGQDYLGWLMGEGVGYDILRTVAAYNGGPGTLQKTATMLGEDDESLMVIECMPAVETRNYVERVMAAYWTYQKKFGQESRTLDALATGQKYIDARWDAPLPAAKVVVAEDEDAKASPKADKQARRGKRG